MRPGRYRPGCATFFSNLYLLAHASMRPGRYRPGCSRCESGSWCAGGASMRPGRYRPGCASINRKHRRHRERFNEAGAISPRMREDRSTWQSKTSGASMRPGRYRPGCRAAAIVLVTTHWASMRPGRYRPGCLLEKMARNNAIRGFNEAGAISPRMRCKGGAGRLRRAWLQ